jgi:predicted glycoside hydrolase/deacetylase ChbG (UPF0249 family)
VIVRRWLTAAFAMMPATMFATMLATMLVAPAVVAQLPAKRLIIHADDIGMSESVNRAAFALVERGTVTSLSMIVPAPAFEHAVAWLKVHPDVDVGVQLTLTSEWSAVRWRPVSPADSVPSLVDADGMLKQRWSASSADPRDVDRELRAQISLARRSGVTITHLDVQHFALYGVGRLYAELLAQIATDEDLPLLLAHDGLPGSAEVAAAMRDPIIIDAITSIGPGTMPSQWAHYYDGVVRMLPTGVTELIVHPGFDDAELRAMTAGVGKWGAAWRQRDYDVLASDAFKQLLDERSIVLARWQTLRRIDTGQFRRP